MRVRARVRPVVVTCMDTTLIGAGPHLDLIPRGPAPRYFRPGAPRPPIYTLTNVYGKVSARTYIYA